jgi:hypothetical protein
VQIRQASSHVSYIDLDQGIFSIRGRDLGCGVIPQRWRFGSVNTDDLQGNKDAGLSNNLAAELSILAIVVIVLLHGHANNVVHMIASRHFW